MLTTKAKISLARAVQAPLMGMRHAVGLGPELVVTRSRHPVVPRPP